MQAQRKRYGMAVHGGSPDRAPRVYPVAMPSRQALISLSIHPLEETLLLGAQSSSHCGDICNCNLAVLLMVRSAVSASTVYRHRHRHRHSTNVLNSN